MEANIVVNEQVSEQGLTIDKHLLLPWQDADQVSTVKPTLPLGSVPGATVREVLVAVRLKLLPTKSTNLSVCSDRDRHRYCHNFNVRT